MQIAVTSEGSRLSDADLAFMVAAVNDQAFEFCEAWGLPPVAVAWYARGTSLPPTTTHALVIMPTIDVDGALGHHDDKLGIIYSIVLEQDETGTSTTLSHEVLEMILDPTCDQWRGPNALEACDAVEADCYPQTVTVAGEARSPLVSNYLLPSWFDPAGELPFDRMGRLTAPGTMTPGGYLIVRDDHGNVSNVFASRVPQTFGRKLANPRSRTLTRLRQTPGRMPVADPR